MAAQSQQPVGQLGSERRDGSQDLLAKPLVGGGVGGGEYEYGLRHERQAVAHGLTGCPTRAPHVILDDGDVGGQPDDVAVTSLDEGDQAVAQHTQLTAGPQDLSVVDHAQQSCWLDG